MGWVSTSWLMCFNSCERDETASLKEVGLYSMAQNFWSEECGYKLLFEKKFRTVPRAPELPHYYVRSRRSGTIGRQTVKCSMLMGTSRLAWWLHCVLRKANRWSRTLYGRYCCQNCGSDRYDDVARWPEKPHAHTHTLIIEPSTTLKTAFKFQPYP